MSMTVHGIDIVVGSERRAAIDIARDFVREQSAGEWGDEMVERDARQIADLMIAFAEKRGAGLGWHPIDTAPKDGTHILITRPTMHDEEKEHVVRWDDDWWQVHDGKNDWPLRGADPTAWMPLPSDPA